MRSGHGGPYPARRRPCKVSTERSVCRGPICAGIDKISHAGAPDDALSPPLRVSIPQFDCAAHAQHVLQGCATPSTARRSAHREFTTNRQETFVRRVLTAISVLMLTATALPAQTLLYSGWGTQGVEINSWGYNYAQLAAPFSLAGEATLTGARIPFAAFGCGTDQTCGLNGMTLSWAVYSDNGGNLPGSRIAFGVATPTTPGTYDPAAGQIRSYWNFSLPNVVAPAAGQYWLGVQNSVTGNCTPCVMWLTRLSGGTVPPGASYNPVSDTWAPIRPTDDAAADFGNRLGVDIFGAATTTPEPATVALLAPGLIGIAGALRRRRPVAKP